MSSAASPAQSSASAQEAALTRLQSDLVARIVAEIKNQQPPPGERFTELGLANRFGVSRSPVREALRHLADRGVLRFEEKRGFFLDCRPEKIGEHLKGLTPSPEEELYGRIVGDRMRRRSGDSFTASEFMRRYDCNRPLLLRVLSRLTEEGIIRAGRGHAWSFVALLDDEEAVKESYRLRLVLEPAGLLEPTLALDRPALEKSLEVHRQVIASGARALTGQKMFEINAEFHELLARCSGNRFMLQNMQHQNRMRRLNEYSAFRDRERMLLSCREHSAILEALLEGETARAAELLRAHLQDAVDYVP